MALVRTTLTAAIKASDLTLSVLSTGTGFPAVGTVAANQPVLVDNELMFITGVPLAGQVVVRGRGSDGTHAVAHDVLAPVVTSTTPALDFPVVPTGSSTLHRLTSPDQVTLGQDGAIPVPVQDSKVLLAKATAAAMTLAAPSLGSNGVELLITSGSAAAHVVTATSLLDTGAAGVPFSTATFPAQPGASVLLIAQNGLWNVAATNGAIVFA